jgi:CheY-like chemotaxis protein
MNPDTAVMIVDDDEDVIEIGTLVLEAAGFRVVAAGDGVDALEILEREEPLLILLDLMMPIMDGEQFLQALRARNITHIPVILMSGYSGALEIAHEFSTAALLRKPVDMDVLLKTVRDVSRKRREEP